MDPTVRYEREPPIVTIAIDRIVRKNAVDRDCAAELADSFRRFEADPALSVAILTGRGGTFCAGADLKAIAAGSGNRLEADGDGPMGPTRMHLEKPTVAAIEGYAVAGGLELAVFCDLRVAARDARLGVLCRRLGVPLIDGGTIRLTRLVGHSHALDLLLTGREIDAIEAARMGLVNRVCEPGEALATAKALAREIAAHPQGCLRHDRASSYEQWSMSIDEALQNELRHGMAALADPAFFAGVARFVKP